MCSVHDGVAGVNTREVPSSACVVSYTDIDHITTGVVGDTYRGIEMASVRIGFGKYHVRQDGLIQETARYEPGEAFPGIVP